jgi:hypothetical protein
MASITCGKCKSTHASIAEVKACYGTVTAQSKVDFSVTSGVVTMATPRQKVLIPKLLVERGLPERDVETLTGEAARALITELIAMPRASYPPINELIKPSVSEAAKPAGPTLDEQIKIAAAALPQLRKMHYAIEERDFTKNDGEPVWKFYRVDLPTKGKWAGRIFLDIQASDDYHPVRDSQRKLNVLQAIGFNAEKAASDYGHQIGRCGVCRRTLTDDVSIDRGIGPVCAKKVGW